MKRSASDSPLLFDIPLAPDFSEEKRLLSRGLKHIVGIDEAGRGPLAGPVVAAAVVLDINNLPDGLDDSKRLTPERRDELFAEILKKAAAVSVSSVSAGGIDRINILRASLEAMRRALCGLAIRPLHALVDGRDIPPGLTCGAEALVKGDQRSQSIAAASIVAKVVRDRMMENCGRTHVHYDFESHMGYATPRHRSAIDLHGAVPRIHRTSFSPFRIDGEVVVEETIELLVDA